MSSAVKVTATRGLLQIGEVAEQTGLSVRSIRHYEEVGLLPEADRSPGGFRLYTSATVKRLLVITGLKPLGFSLEQMREVVDLLEEFAVPGTTPVRLRELTELLGYYRGLVDEGVTKLRLRLSSAERFQGALALQLDAVPSAASW